MLKKSLISFVLLLFISAPLHAESKVQADTALERKARNLFGDKIVDAELDKTDQPDQTLKCLLDDKTNIWHAKKIIIMTSFYLAGSSPHKGHLLVRDQQKYDKNLQWFVKEALIELLTEKGILGLYPIEIVRRSDLVLSDSLDIDTKDLMKIFLVYLRSADEVTVQVFYEGPNARAIDWPRVEYPVVFDLTNPDTNNEEKVIDTLKGYMDDELPRRCIFKNSLHHNIFPYVH